ncbi:MAG: fluoride efflux transporter CrcB [Phycisphaerae bacterium]
MSVRVVTLLLIGLGGAAGSMARYLLSGWVQQFSAAALPLGTLSVNLAGCFFIGLLNTALTGPLLIREEQRLALVVGVLGGFTTFTAFGWETLELLRGGQHLAAVGNVLVSVFAGLAAVWLGARLATTWLGGGG